MAVRRVHRAAAAAPDGPSARAAALAEATAISRSRTGRAAPRSRRTVASRCRGAPAPDPLQHGPARDRLATAPRSRSSTRCTPPGELDEVLACEARPLLQGAPADRVGAGAGRRALPAHRRLGRRRGDGQRPGGRRRSSAATASRRTATRPTRSAPTASRCWRGTTGSRSSRRPATTSFDLDHARRRGHRRRGARSATRSADRAGPPPSRPPTRRRGTPPSTSPPPPSSTGFITDVGVVRAAVRVRAPDRHARPRDRGRGSLPVTELETRRLLVELLGAFYAKGWVSGTGGGICGPADGGNLLLAPTGVHKERVQPDEFFVVDPADGTSFAQPPRRTACARASATRSSASPSANGRPAASSTRMRCPRSCSATWPTASDHVAIARPRDAQGHPGRRQPRRPPRAGHPQHRRASRSSSSSSRPCSPTSASRQSAAVLVADHGAYIWGEDVWEAKRHAEVYHFLFEATVARRDTPRDQARRDRRKEGVA